MKESLRTCLVSREKLPKKQLIRIVRTVKKEAVIDYEQNLPGRGAYLKKDKTIINQAIKNKVIDRKLQIKIPEELYQQLLGDYNG